MYKVSKMTQIHMPVVQMEEVINWAGSQESKQMDTRQ